MKVILSLLRSLGLGLFLTGFVLVGRGFWELRRVSHVDCAGLSEQECDLKQELALVDSGRLRWLGVALVSAGVGLFWSSRLLDKKKT